METRVSTKLASIEILRGIAAIVVIFYHTARHVSKAHDVTVLKQLTQFGHAGVDLFFVISGFIILFVHTRDVGQPSRLTHYGGRRFSRVMPTYWVALCLTILMSVAGGHAMAPLQQILWSATLLPSFQEPLLGVAWTLQYEIVFYAVFSALIVNRLAGLIILALWLIWVLAVWMGVVEAPVTLPPSMYGVSNIEFFFGMAIAFWLRRSSIPVPMLWATAGAILFAVSAIAEDLRVLDGYSSAARLAYGVPSALMILGLVGWERSAVPKIPGWLRHLGGASYSLYLFQFVFIGSVWQIWRVSGLDDRLPAWASFPVLAGAAITGGIIVHRIVEQPLLQWLRHTASRRPALQT